MGHNIVSRPGMFALLLAGAALSGPVMAQEDKFRQMEGTDWPAPNDYRNASGAPGYRYWQQKADYQITARLDERARTVTGREVITYRNNSPDPLPYLWLLLDQNIARHDSTAERSSIVPPGKTSLARLARDRRMQSWEGGFDILSVTDANGRALTHSVTDTLMRIDLQQPVPANGGVVKLVIYWSYPILETKVVGGRNGYECFEGAGEDGNCIFLGAQWFPRLAAYSDYEGWHNKAFLGAGEFTLEFGDYDVGLTVPADHVVAATGEVANPETALKPEWRARLAQARAADQPVYIVTPQEATAAEAHPGGGEKVWRFRAQNVRDFAWASSRKFIWDAMGVRQAAAERPLVMAMSFYPKEARPLWDAWATKAAANTIRTYSDFTFPYPYPVVQSVEAAGLAIEYPMINFTGQRPEKDPVTGRISYSEQARNLLIGIVTHEVGHNYFPMVVNSDERQWAWMDEGLNSFLTFQAEKRWDRNFASRRGEPVNIGDYMTGKGQTPIMTQADSADGMRSAYDKTATALTILRETVMGPDLFDRAFREYAVRWRFKHPTPYDFFRTMEKSSGIDLDWFWRGWFYSTDHVDLALKDVVEGRIDPDAPTVTGGGAKAITANIPGSLTASHVGRTVVETDPAVRDWYSATPGAIGKGFTAQAGEKGPPLSVKERSSIDPSRHFYRLTIDNLGGLVTPIPIGLTFTDGTVARVTLPAEIWRRNSTPVTWEYATGKTLSRVELDPGRETADTDIGNNARTGPFPAQTLTIERTAEPVNEMKRRGLSVKPDALLPVE